MLDLIGTGLESEGHQLRVADGSPGHGSARTGHGVVPTKLFSEKTRSSSSHS